MSFPALNHLPTKGISPRDIHVGTRFRPADTTGVEVLAASMANEGLMMPIAVRANGNQNGNGAYTLVWGLHRLQASLALGWDLIDAKIIPASAEWTTARLQELEALENLARADLSPYDRAITVKGLRDVMLRAAGLVEGQSAKALGGYARHDNSATANLAVADLAQRIGRPKRSVERDLELADRLQSALAEAARGRTDWLNATVVTDLAALGLEVQLELVGWLKANPEASLKDALKALKPCDSAAETDQDKAVKVLDGYFNRLKIPAQTAFVTQLVQRLTPAQKASVLAELAV